MIFVTIFWKTILKAGATTMTTKEKDTDRCKVLNTKCKGILRRLFDDDLENDSDDDDEGKNKYKSLQCFG